jgi:hypothetical protein
MNRYCWDPGFYTAVRFACVPIGNAGLMMCNLTYILNLCFSSMFNKLHMNIDCTAI